MQIFVLFATVSAITIVSIALVTWRSRHRSRVLASTAAALGLRYQRDGGDLLNDGLLELPLFTLATVKGHSTLSNVMNGKVDGTIVTAFDYAYWTGSVNDQRFDYAQTVVCFRLQANRYPAFGVHPVANRLSQASMAAARRSAEILTTIAKPIASRDNRWAALEGALEKARQETIDIVAPPEFSHRYQVIGSNYQRVIELLNQNTMELLLREEFYPLSVECSGVWLAIYRKNHRVAPRDVQHFLERCVTLHNSLFGHGA